MMIKELSKYWITEPSIDFELKKYQLLGYLNFVQQNLEENRIFPYINDIQEHYQLVKSLRKSKHALLKNMKSEIESLDLIENKINYKEKNIDTTLIKEIDQIIDFSLEKLKTFRRLLLTHYKELIQTVKVEQIGVSPIYNQEGYLLINSSERINVFGYKVDKLLPVIRINTYYVDSYPVALSNSYENIKLDLISSNKELPNPATYAIKSKEKLPLYETLLPMSKSMVFNYIQSK